jgi:hypothetical protein
VPNSFPGITETEFRRRNNQLPSLPMHEDNARYNSLSCLAKHHRRIFFLTRQI